MKFLITIAVILVAGALAGLGVMYSGVYNVAATEPHNALSNWVLNTTMENSVARYARDIEVPDLKGPEQLYAGINNYQEMCAGCHAPPGEKPSAVAKGLNPEPPDLAKSAEHMSPQEIFWVVKHGVKMTGMPAWKPTHDDNELWPIVTFVERMPDMTPAKYQALKARAKEMGGGHHHEAGGGHQGHSANGGRSSEYDYPAGVGDGQQMDRHDDDHDGHQH